MECTKKRGDFERRVIPRSHLGEISLKKNRRKEGK